MQLQIKTQGMKGHKKWLKKYQTVEPRESLVILKNNIPVKEQPGIKKEVKLPRLQQAGKSLGVKV